MAGGVADQVVILGDDVGEAVLAINAHVDQVGDAVADAGGEAVFKAVHGFAASKVRGDVLVVGGGVHGLEVVVEESDFVKEFHSSGEVDTSVATQIPVDAPKADDDPLQ